jgi:hypothetical protein
MAVSDIQLEANQKNAERSTGPTTPEGKARSSQNAVKHGLTARRTVITVGDGAESIEDYERLLSALQEEFNPETAYEELCVDRIAHLMWQEQRAQLATIGVLRRGRDSASFRVGTLRSAAVEKAVQHLVEAPGEHSVRALRGSQTAFDATDHSALFGTSEGLTRVIGFLIEARDSIALGQPMSHILLLRLKSMYGSEHELSAACANVRVRKHGSSSASPQPASPEIALLETEIEKLKQLRSEYERVEDLQLEVQIDLSGFVDSPELHEIRRYETSHGNQLRKEIDEYWRRKADRAKTHA